MLLSTKITRVRSGEGHQLSFMVPGMLFTCYGLRTVPIVSTFVLHDNNKEFLLYNFWGLLDICTVYDPSRVPFIVSLSFSHALTKGCS